MYVESSITLSDFVDSLQERGQYTFSRDDALSAMGVSPVALKRAAERLKAKQRLATPRRGFYTIVPLEYRQSGAPPAASFIDQLMRFHDTPYYVGLLSAAELHGAAHQKPVPPIRSLKSSRYSRQNSFAHCASQTVPADARPIFGGHRSRPDLAGADWSRDDGLA